MTYFIHSGNTYRAIPGTSIDPINSLPPENFVLKHSPFTGFFLEQTPEFTLPKKLYGKTKFHAERILNTFNQRQSNTGVILMGEKGSGKSLLSKQICVDSGYPAIIINDCYHGDEFNSFLSEITQPCIVFFDEFEKVYDRDDQQKVLTLFDGTFNSNKLFLLTANNRWGLDDNMCNRPGRIYYMLEFDGLDEDFIREYCQDRLNDVSYTEKIVQVSKNFDTFNFDLLSAFVEEINRYDEEPSDLMVLLNAKPRFGSDRSYVAHIVFNGEVCPSFNISDFNIYDENINIRWNLFTDGANYVKLQDLANSLQYAEVANMRKAGHISFSRNFRMKNPDGGIQRPDHDCEVAMDVVLDPTMCYTDPKTSEFIYEVNDLVTVRLKRKNTSDNYAHTS